MWAYAVKLHALLSPEGRRRWARVLPLILVSSASEAIGAAGVFALVAAVADPSAVGAIPVVGDGLRSLSGDDPRRARLLLILAIAAFYFLKALVVVAAEYAQAHASTRSASDLSSRLLTGYLRAPYLFHLRRNSADLVHTTTHLAGSSFALVVNAIVHTAAEVLVLLSILCVLLLIAPGVTLLAAAVLTAIGSAMLAAMRKYSLRLGLQARDLSASSMRHQTQALSAVDEIMVLDRADYFAREFEQLAGRFADVMARQNFSLALPRVIVETLFICGALCVTVALVLAGVSNTRTISLLGLFAYAGFRIIPSANRILYHAQTIRHGAAGIDHILADIRELEILSSPCDESPIAPLHFADRIDLAGVSLDYGGGAPIVLESIDVSIERGRTVAIVGATGSGKSSIVRLIVGLLSPTRGEVLVDGVALPQVLRGWRRQLGYVPQEVHLIDDSLRRNIALGRADAEIDDAAIDEALRRAQLDRFVASLPEGLDTRVGDRGVRLSGGERQRTGIARALYNRPSVLILDEATSALDPQTEAAILGALRAELSGSTVERSGSTVERSGSTLKRSGSTLIAVTHRLHGVRDFDQVVFIHHGRIHGLGTYDELSAAHVEFRQLAATMPDRI